MTEKPFRIAVASGKGGTGKTTFAVALALVSPGAQLLDCDVEAPNAHLSLDVAVRETDRVEVIVPSVDESRCDLCAGLPGAVCREVCEFGAIAALPDRVMLFPELCHSCGACMDLCPRNAVREARRAVGVVESGTASGHPFVQGRLNIGEPRSVEVIRAVRRRLRPTGLAVLDLSPGVACPTVEGLRDADAALLLTEPTPFGLHDLELAADLCGKLEIPAGVVLNRSDLGDDAVERFCSRRELPILMRVPHDRVIAEAGALGRPLPMARPDLVEPLAEVIAALRGLAIQEDAA